MAYVPKNRSTTQRIGLVKTRNIVEAVIVTGTICVSICIMPFILKAKIIFCLVFGGIAAILNLIGIKNRSVTETIWCFIKHESGKRALRLRSVNDERIKESKSKEKSGYYKKISDFFDDENLYGGSGSKTTGKEIAKFIKTFVTNIKSGIGL